MGLLWTSTDNSKSNKSTTEESEKLDLPADLANYLNEKESQLSDREFKSLLRRQSTNHQNDSTNQVDFIRELQQQHELTEQQKLNDKKILDNELLKTEAISNAINKIDKNNINQYSDSISNSNEYVNSELESYKRNNDEKEAILTNCSEIQDSFFKCLSKQTSWDRITAVANLKNDDCTKLADFFIACSDVQKKAFLMFEYSSLNKIEEFENARKRIDRCFTNNFKDIDDISNKKLFLKYTKDLRKEREDFFEKFGK